MNITCNIHNILKIKLNNISRHLVKDLNIRYHYFEDKDCDNDLDMLATIGPFKPDLKGCYCLDRKFYIRKNYIYLEDSDKKLKWQAEIFDIEKDFIRINFHHNFKNRIVFPWCLFPDLILDLYVLQPIIEWKLALKGCLLTHSGAVCKDGKAMLLLGRGGSGKTQIVIELLEKGFDFISDDMVIIKGEDVLSLPLSPGLFTFSYERLKREDLGFFDQVRLFKFLSKKNCRILPVVDSAELEKLFVLLPMKNAESRICDIGKKELIRCLMLNQEMEKTSYVSYKYIIGSFLKAYEYVFPRIDFNAPLDRLRQKLFNDLKTNNIETRAIEFSQGQNISDLICQ